MAVKTTKIQCNQDVDLRGKVDVEGKVTCGSNVEVDGKLQINSAKDLVTKDGTSIGDGGALYEPAIVKPDEGAIYIPTDLVEKYDKGKTLGVLLFGNQMPYCLLKDEQTATNALSIISYDSENQTTVYTLYPINKSDGKIDITNPIKFSPLSQDTFFTYLSAIEKNIEKKQATIYRHTVTFTQGIEPDFKGRFTFTDKSEKNTPIDSIQDLIAVFGNTDIQLSGCANFDQAYIMEKIHVGSSVDDTKFFYTNIDDYYMPQDNSYSAFDTGDTITITDNVTAM